MKEYSVCIALHASAYFKVKADSKEEAVKKAYKNMPVTVCNYCSDTVEIGEVNEEVEPDVVELSKKF